jgi:hypothetical protein
MALVSRRFRIKTLQFLDNQSIRDRNDRGRAVFRNRDLV